jgi:hypothetical protein
VKLTFHHVNSRLFPETEAARSPSDKSMSERDRREEMLQHLAHLEALAAHCGDCTKLSLDFRAHLTKHSATAPPEAAEAAVPADAAPVRITRQRLETIGRQTSEARPDSVVQESIF